MKINSGLKDASNDDCQPNSPPLAAPYSTSTLNLYYQNVRGLNTKLKDLVLAINTCQYEILAFTETWLNSHIMNTEILSPNFNIIRCDRNFVESNK